MEWRATYLDHGLRIGAFTERSQPCQHQLCQECSLGNMLANPARCPNIIRLSGLHWKPRAFCSNVEQPLEDGAQGLGQARLILYALAPLQQLQHCHQGLMWHRPCTCVLQAVRCGFMDSPLGLARQEHAL